MPREESGTVSDFVADRGRPGLDKSFGIIDRADGSKEQEQDREDAFSTKGV